MIEKCHLDFLHPPPPPKKGLFGPVEEHRLFNPHSFLSLVGLFGGVKHMQLQKSWIKFRRNRDTEVEIETRETGSMEAMYLHTGFGMGFGEFRAGLRVRVGQNS